MYNSIPNIDKKNCIAYEYHDRSANNILSTSEYTRYIISLPIGSYEIFAINDYIQKQLKKMVMKTFLKLQLI